MTATTADPVPALSERVTALLQDRGDKSLRGANDVRDLHRLLGEELTAMLSELIANAPPDSKAAGNAVLDLHRLTCELIEWAAIDRLEALERVRVAIARLVDAGPASEILERAPAEACEAIRLDRVLLSRIEDSRLVAEVVHCRNSEDAAATLAQLRVDPPQLAYPLIESEALRRRRALLVTETSEDPQVRQAYWEVMRWNEYVVAPIVLEGHVTGFLHGDRRGEEPVSIIERDAMARFAEGFAAVFERAVLQRRLRIQRKELRQFAAWAEGRTSELSNGVVDLSDGRGGADPPEPSGAGAVDARLRELLTRRELDVLEHMVRGETNADIARGLVVSEGTVKFHVKNILRKLHASNRAEAAARYLRLSLRG